MKYIVVDNLDTSKRVAIIVVEPKSGQAGFVAGRSDVVRVIKNLLQRKVLFEIVEREGGSVRRQVTRRDADYVEFLRTRLNPPLHSLYWGTMNSEDIDEALHSLWDEFGPAGEMPHIEAVDDVGVPTRDAIPARLR